MSAAARASFKVGMIQMRSGLNPAANLAAALGLIDTTSLWLYEVLRLVDQENADWSRVGGAISHGVGTRTRRTNPPSSPRRTVNEPPSLRIRA